MPVRPLPGLTQANDTPVTSASYNKLGHRGFRIQWMVKFRDSCRFHRWARPAEKKPSLFKVTYLSESVHTTPLALALTFFRGCHQGIGAGGPAPCTGLPLSQDRSPESGSQLLDLSRQKHLSPPAACPGACLIPAWHRPQLPHVLGRAARLPAKNHKLSKPKPAESQALVPSTAGWG